MGRGSDETGPPPAPRRNPLGRRIKSSKEAKREKEEKKETRPLPAEAPERKQAEEIANPPTSASIDPSHQDILRGLPVNAYDPFDGSDLSYILDSSRVDNLRHDQATGQYSFVSWREKDGDGSLGDYRGIVYSQDLPVMIVRYDEDEESYLLYGYDQMSNMTVFLDIPVYENRGLFGQRRARSCYATDPQTALLRDITEDIIQQEYALERAYEGW